MAVLRLYRGLPGSGKTTMAKGSPALLVEADMYFQRDGDYKYDRAAIRDAHDWCKRIVRQALARGVDVNVANSFVKVWELDGYAQLAREAGAELEIVEVKGQFQSTHDVPGEVMDRMASQWQECWVVDGSIHHCWNI